MVDLHPAGFETSGAESISASGQIVGAGYIRPLGEHALLWQNPTASVVDLNPSSMVTSYAYATDGTQQVGNIGTQGTQHAVLWSGSAESAVDLHPEGFSLSQAFAVCNGKQVGGAFTTGYIWHAIIWSGTADSFVDLQQYVPLPYDSCMARAIDQAGIVYGLVRVYDESEAHAAMWVPVPEPVTGMFLGAMLLLYLGRYRNE